jgi:hypothetical protein
MGKGDSEREQEVTVMSEDAPVHTGAAALPDEGDAYVAAGEAERQVLVVPRCNDNGARAKSGRRQTIPTNADVMRLYADYLNTEYGALDWRLRLRQSVRPTPRPTIGLSGGL